MKFKLRVDFENSKTNIWLRSCSFEKSRFNDFNSKKYQMALHNNAIVDFNFLTNSDDFFTSEISSYDGICIQPFFEI